jgi:hypothetical protein
MGANQNSSIELGLCLKTDPTVSLLTRLRPHSYWKSTSLRNQVRYLGITAETRISESNATREPTATKAYQQTFSPSVCDRESTTEVRR